MAYQLKNNRPGYHTLPPGYHTSKTPGINSSNPGYYTTPPGYHTSSCSDQTVQYSSPPPGYHTNPCSDQPGHPSQLGYHTSTHSYQTGQYSMPPPDYQAGASGQKDYPPGYQYYPSDQGTRPPSSYIASAQPQHHLPAHAEKHPGNVQDPASQHARKPLCRICSTIDRPVYHRHFSSKFGRFLMGANKPETITYNCPSCKKMHKPNHQKRIKLVLSTSTLHMWFAPAGEECLYKGDSAHRDYLTIPGARIVHLHEAFLAEYGTVTIGMDIVMVAGLNDVARGYTRNNIMQCITDLRKAVSKQAEDYHPDVKNTFAVSALLYPPQLCWFEDNGPFPHPDYKNNLEKVDWLNNEIETDNKAAGIEFAPDLNTFGVRTANRKIVDRFGNVTVKHTTTHRWGEWREKERGNMLHLNDKRRVAMGKHVSNYFTNCTDNSSDD